MSLVVADGREAAENAPKRLRKILSLGMIDYYPCLAISH
jgi:hypothetical protein